MIITRSSIVTVDKRVTSHSIGIICGIKEYYKK